MPLPPHARKAVAYGPSLMSSRPLPSAGNRITETGTLKRVMKAFDWQLHKHGYIPMSGQIVDASLVPAPKQRNTDGEWDAIKAGKSADEIWSDEPARAVQKDADARCMLKIGNKVRYRTDGTPLPTITIPVFGYKSHRTLQINVWSSESHQKAQIKLQETQTKSPDPAKSNTCQCAVRQ